MVTVLALLYGLAGDTRFQDLVVIPPVRQERVFWQGMMIMVDITCEVARSEQMLRCRAVTSGGTVIDEWLEPAERRPSWHNYF